MTDKITVVYFDGVSAKLIQIPSCPSLEELQTLVKGYVEVLPLPKINPEGQRLHLICNEEGKMLFPYLPSLFLRNQDGYLLDVVFGPCFICGNIDSSGDTDIFYGLSKEDFDQIKTFCGVAVSEKQGPN